MKVKAAMYIRVSSSRQAQESDSFDGQRLRIQEYAEKHGYQIVAEYCDTASGFKEDVTRPGMEQLMSDVAFDRFSFEVVLVYKFSRFSRVVDDQEARVKSLLKSGIRLISITEPLPESASIAKILRVIFGVMNENNSEQNRQIVRDRLEETAKKGFYTGGRVPYGYKSVEVIDPNSTKRRFKLAINDDEISVVREIFSLAEIGLNGKPMGVKAIAAHLNDRRTKYRNGKPFNRNIINRMLRNPCYKGEYRFKSHAEGPESDAIIVPVPKAVSPEHFDTIQNGLEERQLKNRDTKRKRSAHLLTGILKCPSCHEPMNYMRAKSGRYHYYRCAKQVRESANACNESNIREEVADTIVKNEIIPLIFKRDFILSVSQEVQTIIADINRKKGHNKLQLDKKISERKEQLHTLHRRLTEAEFEVDEYFNTYKESLTTELRALEASLNEYNQLNTLPFWNFGERQADQFLKLIEEVIVNDSTETLKCLLLSVIDEIVIRKDVVTATGKRIALLSEVSKKRKECRCQRSMSIKWDPVIFGGNKWEAL